MCMRLSCRSRAAALRPGVDVPAAAVIIAAAQRLFSVIWSSDVQSEVILEKVSGLVSR